MQNCWVMEPSGRPTFADLCTLFGTWHARDAVAAAEAEEDAVAVAIAISAAAAAAARPLTSSGSSGRFPGQQASNSALSHWEPIPYSNYMLEDALARGDADKVVFAESVAQPPPPPSTGGNTPASPVCVVVGEGGATTMEQPSAPLLVVAPVVDSAVEPGQMHSPSAVSVAAFLGGWHGI